jgi:L-threonylcarbamoyladenylate synthase
LRKQAANLAGERVGLMLPTALPGRNTGINANLAHLNADLGAFAAVFPWGDWSDPEQLAHRLFAGLRHLDALGCTVILCPLPSQQGIGVAIADRLRKAAVREVTGTSEDCL